MKILLINDYLSDFWWAEKIFYDQKSVLEQNWHHVWLLWDENKNDNFLSFFQRYFSLKYLYKTYQIIKKEKIDIIHCHNLARNISPSPVIAAKLLWKKVIMTLHDFHYYCPKKLGVLENGNMCTKWFNSLCYLKNCHGPKRWYKYIPYNLLKWIKIGFHRMILKRYVDCFLSPSRKLQEYMIKSLQLPKEKIIYLPNFIEIEKHHTLNFDDINDKKFLFVGRLSKEKWIDIAIKAFDILINKIWIQDIYLEIAWEWPERNNLENLIKWFSLEKHIKLLWKIENKNLKEYYESSIWLIMPSTWLENYWIVNIEAMKYGTPIIWSNVWGIPEIIEDWKNGFLFKMWNHIELAEKIKLLYWNKSLSIEMWKAGFHILQSKFNSQLFYENLITVYR